MSRLLAASAIAAAAVTAAAAPTMASDRELGAHEHGAGALNIAIEGEALLMELEAPGADIVGFEYAAESAEDRAAIDAAIATLSEPLKLFAAPAAAGCVVTAASVELIGDDADHEEHHDEHAHDEHDKHDDEHAHDDHDKHDDEHAHEDHDKHDDEHAHEDHADEASHTEFHAEYALTCSNMNALTEIDFGYFAAFPNARELDVQLVSGAGAKGFEVERAAPRLDLDGAI